MKDKIITISFLIYIAIFSILGLLLKDEQISFSERRKLTKFPKLTLSNELSADIDKYLLDHFPYRDTFRSIKAHYNYQFLNQYDNNNIYLHDEYIFKSEYPTNKKSISNFLETINILKEDLSSNNNVYITIIPDKNYYLDSSNFLQIDYNYLYNEISKLNIKTINITKIMNLTDYYQTDTHWRQENLAKVISKLNDTINFDYIPKNYIPNTYSHFYGVYYGESALDRQPEHLIYLTNDIINNAQVKYLENKDIQTVYNLDNLESLDSYEVFLDGASSFIEIFNPNCTSNRELVIFRDSFASSLTPLLIPYYQKITLIDNRYISKDNYLKLITFTNQDILFLYSTLIVNNSSTLKK